MISNADLKTRMIALDSFQSYVVCLIQDWEDINFGDADTSSQDEVQRLTNHYVDTYRTDISADNRPYAYQTVWSAFQAALPEITNPTE